MGRAFLSLLLLGLAALAGYLLHGALGDEPPEQESTSVERATPAVITKVQSLSRLEGTRYFMERVIDLKDRQSRLSGLIEAEDALLLVAAGEVVAGVDLGRIVEADIETSLDQRSVVLRLPPAEIFSAHLDAQRTYVHTRKTDALAQRREDLETRARARAEESLEQAALQAGILEEAEAGVRRTLTFLLLGLGFDHVSVEFSAKPPPRE